MGDPAASQGRRGTDLMYLFTRLFARLSSLSLFSILFLHILIPLNTASNDLLTPLETTKVACDCVNNTQIDASGTQYVFNNSKAFIKLTSRRVGNSTEMAFLTCNNSQGLSMYNVSWSVYAELALPLNNSSNSTSNLEDFSWTPNCTNYLNKTEDVTTLEQFTMKRPINLSHVVVTALVLGMTFCFHSCVKVRSYRVQSREIRSLPKLEKLLGTSMFKNRRVLEKTVKESNRRREIDTALMHTAKDEIFLHLGATRKSNLHEHGRSVRQLIANSNIELEEAILASGLVPRRKLGESVREYLLITIPGILTSSPQYSDRAKSYVRTFERAHFGCNVMTVKELERVRNEVHSIKAMFSTS